MSENNDDLQAYSAVAAPSPALRSLDKLVGTWKVSGRESGPEGEIHGQVTYEWLDGGYFLIQRIDMVHIDHEIKGIEVIGYERSWEGETSPDCTSHFFGNTGESFTYVYDVDDDSLTIWGGERGSPAAFKGKFSSDRNQVSGAWEWPGGGYSSTMTRVG